MLTLKKEKFVQELLKGKSQRQAYIASFDTSKMKTSTIDNKACNLFKEEEVRTRYKELRSELTKDSMDDVKDVRKMIIEQEKAVLNTSFGELIKLGVSPEGTMIEAVPKKNLDKFDLRAVQELRYDSRGNLILKLYDKQDAIDTLREMYGIGSEEGDGNINIILKNAEGYDE